MSVERAGKGESRWHSMNLRFGGDAFEKFENRIEALDVADLQHAILLLRQLAQFGGLRGIVGHRLFDQHVFALREQGLGDFKMRGGGRDDVQRVAGGGGFGDGSEHAQLVFLRDFAGGFGVRVENAGEFHLSGGVEFGINAGVMLAERAGAQDGDFDFCHARSLPEANPSGKSLHRHQERQPPASRKSSMIRT